MLLGTVNTFHDYQGLFCNWLSKYALQYAIRRVQKIKAGLKLNRTYQLWVYPIAINWFDDYINTINNNTKLLLTTSKDDGRKLTIHPVRRTKKTGRDWNKPLSQWHSLKKGLCTKPEVWVADVVQMDDDIVWFLFWGKITSWNKYVRGKNKTVLFQFPTYKWWPWCGELQILVSLNLAIIIWQWTIFTITFFTANYINLLHGQTDIKQSCANQWWQ